MKTHSKTKHKITTLIKSTETLTTLLKLYHHKIRQQEILNLKEVALNNADRQRAIIQEQLRQIQTLIADIEIVETSVQKEIDKLYALAESQLRAVDGTMDAASAKAFITETLEKFTVVRERLVKKSQTKTSDISQSEDEILNELKTLRNSTAHAIEHEK